MKRFKVGACAIVAILTMSFTVASHEGAFKKSVPNAKQVYQCVVGVDATALFDCTINLNIPQNAPCQFVKANVLPGHCVVNTMPVGAPMVCNGVNLFCCAQLKPKGSCQACLPNPGQTVIAIWCYH